MLWGSTVPQTMKSIMQQAQHAGTNARKADAIKRIDYYRSEQDQYTLDRIAQWAAEPEKLTPLQINIVRKVINTLAMVYFKAAKRMISTDADQKLFDEIARHAALDVVLKQASKYTKLLKTILLRPVWRNGQIEVDILTGDIVEVETGDSPRDLKKVLIIHYPASGKADETTFSLWTPELFQRLDWRGHVIEEEPNPYGVLPFVPCWDSLPIDDFWIQGGGDLVSAQDAINEKLTDLMHVIRWQAFSLGYLKTDSHGPQGVFSYNSLTIGPGKFVSLPAHKEAEIGFVTPQAAIQETWDVITGIIQQTAIANGLSAHSLTAQPVSESGVSKIVSNLELLERRQDDLELWRRYEQNLFELIKTVWNVHSPSRKFNSGSTLTVDFAEMRQASEENEQNEKWETLIENGQASPVDWAIARNPDLSRDEAKELLRQVKEENKEFYAVEV